MVSYSELKPTNTIIAPPQYTRSKWLPTPSMVNESETDATGTPWLLSPDWTPGKPTGRGRRLTMPPKEALAEIQNIFSRLCHDVCDSMPAKFKENEPVIDWTYVETRHYMMKLQALRGELNALKVSSKDEAQKQGLAITIQVAIMKVEGHVKQKRALSLSHEEHSKIYGRVQAEQCAGRVRQTEPECIIS